MTFFHDFHVFANLLFEELLVVAEFNQHAVHVEIQDLNGADIADRGSENTAAKA